MDAQSLREEMEFEAEWRREMAAEYPNDSHHAEAADRLERLAASVEQIDPAILDTFGSLVDNIEDLRVFTEWLRQIGVHIWPETAEELCREFIAVRAGTA